ncbi:hypothetical protein AKJ09_10553 [Labilithrix luteola]|uniref:Uncharacterized protein n=1 Tax=Labilithrix luteola TaxID=1391654 RepID=A0A0K1QEN2_9BACT|nr:hypothetical protein AKJ09_10553 [Labilithrix luteola]
MGCSVYHSWQRASSPGGGNFDVTTSRASMTSLRRQPTAMPI